MIFLGRESDVYFQRRCRLKFFLPYGSILTKTKKKNRKKSKTQNFEKKKISLEIIMVKRYISTKFGINLFDGFWENGFYGRQTDDGWQ